MRTKVFYALIVGCVLIACSDFVEVEAPSNQIDRRKVFDNDAGVRAAITGVLGQMILSGPFSGGLTSTTVIGGLTSDELNNHNSSTDLIAFSRNAVLPTSNIVRDHWNGMYSYIYQANSIIEALQVSSGVTDSVRSQTVAQAKFIRAFSHFYLVNLFGDVPMVTTTDYRVNSIASRASMQAVYDQIIMDLKDASQNLPSNYSISLGERTEPNAFAAQALLARVYLYLGKWSEASQSASGLIDQLDLRLEPDLNSVFLANSSEAIWQLMPSLPGANTNEGQIFIINNVPSRFSLNTSQVDLFESDDARLSSWVGHYTTGGKTYMYPYKYKIRLQNQPLTEYYMMLRLAEQYLIRAEASARANDLPGAADDINKLRARAGASLLDVTGMSQDEVLLQIERERQRELFAEWGHRWFDLKRNNRADAVLGPIKAQWTSIDHLLPLPQSEIAVNSNLKQNPL